MLTSESVNPVSSIEYRIVSFMFTDMSNIISVRPYDILYGKTGSLNSRTIDLFGSVKLTFRLLQMS